MTSDAEHLEALLAEYVDGQLDASSAKLVEDHLAANPATRAAVAQMKLDRDALRAMPRVTAPADLSEDLRGRLERDLLLNIDPIGKQRSRRFSPPMAAIAAMLMVGLGLAGVAYVLLGNRPKSSLDIALREPVSTAANSPELGKSVSAEDKSKAFAVDKKPAADEASTPSRAEVREQFADAAAAPREEPLVQTKAAPMASKAVQKPDEPLPSPAPSMAAMDAAAAPGVAQSQGELRGGAAVTLPPVAAVPPLQEAQLAVSDEMLPADAAAAIVGRSLDPARRSIVVVVDASQAMEAFASASRFTQSDEKALELTDAGQRLTELPQAKYARDRDAAAKEEATLSQAELAVVARGLAESSASSIQSDLRRFDASQAVAFEVKAPLEGLLQEQIRRDAATTQPSTAAAGGFAVGVLPTTGPTTSPTTAVASEGTALGGPSQLIDLYVVVRQAAVPTSQPATKPTTQPAAMSASVVIQRSAATKDLRRELLSISQLAAEVLRRCAPLDDREEA